MSIYYKSTRGGQSDMSCSQAIVKGLADDGGLFVPSDIPKIDLPFEKLAKMKYTELAFYIIQKFFPEIDNLKECIESAYDEKFDSKDKVELVERCGVSFLELYHGPTAAFKDMALSLLPYLLTSSAKKSSIDKDIVILAATSGDTGKAALAGFAGVEGTKIVVFFPNDGVSAIQKMQMVTQSESNTCVIGIDGNFDDAQTGVKNIFADNELKEKLSENGFMLSSANSINIGRLVPQIVYYVYSYVKLLSQGKVKDGEKVNFVVPTGNFGNILAGYYAMNMGIPVNKLICASNENNVLFDFISTGVYDRKRELVKTNSPSMDILVSSNLERLLYHLSGGNSGEVKKFMDKLSSEGSYSVGQDIKNKLSLFYGGFTSEDQTLETIKYAYENCSYLMDTHTAVAYKVYEDYKKSTGDDTYTVIASTASPFKFTKSVSTAIGMDADEDEFQLMYELSKESSVKVPYGLDGIEKKEIVHKTTCGKQSMENVLSDFLGVK
ncbi:L-threonine synthase [Peptoclostridium litorale DSM 5388]|uniref:Threonine synthase n=1 Tax=Peptoclostridium litorale DSM 5388 TaxID=1121324 RepID=A0A069RA85_PEPLI|nr:threonine synthase [Peptoclostridium litorale]KDR93966.1 threonine synthase ThrC [Peptoclostridium litorale DSM 5388]KDR95393.1 threonine synthase ThrC [Peptoclostridium litorale DSM 5388]SIN89470.1 L-threonine synthase [Peptoclostridium litorale DSM 5388]